MRFALPVLVALGGCSLGATDNSPQAQCARQAQNDPTVKAVYAGNYGDYTQQGTAFATLNWAKRQATQKCLQARGIGPPGGVEPIQPRM
jgi:hypothetical protein